jgi:hypothetical protein
MLVRNVRITALASWSWEDNACAVVLCDGESPWSSTLPPFASPHALYACILTDEATRTILDWLVEPASWSPVDFVGRLNATAQAAAAKALKLPAGAAREHVEAAARERDVQIVPDMGALRGVFDGLALSDDQRASLQSNWHAFGRREKRTTRPPHAVVLAEHDDPLEVQGSDFRRAHDAETRRLASAAPAWKAARRARHACVQFTKEALERDWGADIASIALGAAAAPLISRTSMDSWRTGGVRGAPLPLPVFEGPSTNLCFSHAPGSSPSAIHWFASSIATALGHPRAKQIERHNGPVGVYASHELYGSVYVLSAQGNEALCLGGRAVSRAGLVYAAHPTVAEGACDMFAEHSLEKLGLYCPFGDGRGWTGVLVRRALALLKPGGKVHTNCGGVRADFIKLSAQGL